MLIALVSWSAFTLSALDSILIYQPLKSYFIPIKVASDSIWVNAPAWLLANTVKSLSFNYKLIHELGSWIIVIGLLWSFIHIIKNRNFAKLELKNITFVSIIIAVIATLCIPIDSSDFFAYIARGAQQAYYSVNPFSHVVSEIAEWRADPFLANTLWQHNPSPYGPLFMLICQILVRVSFHNIWLAMFIFKFANLVLFIVSLKLLEAMLKDKEVFSEITQDQGKLIYSLFALNPFVITEVLWNAHNDIYMALGILAAMYLTSKRKYNAAIFILITCSLIKYLSVVLIPLVLIQSYQQEKRLPLWGLALGAILTSSLIGYYDLFHIDYSRISGNISLSHKSLYDVFNSLSKYTSGQDLPNIVKYIFMGGFIVFASAWYYSFMTKASKNELFKYAFWLLFVLLCVCSPKFHSWYLIVFVPLGLFVHSWLIVLLSCTHMLSLTLLDQANTINFILMTALPLLYYFKFYKQSAPSK